MNGRRTVVPATGATARFLTRAGATFLILAGGLTLLQVGGDLPGTLLRMLTGS